MSTIDPNYEHYGKFFVHYENGHPMSRGFEIVSQANFDKYVENYGPDYTIEDQRLGDRYDSYKNPKYKLENGSLAECTAAEKLTALKDKVGQALKGQYQKNIGKANEHEQKSQNLAIQAIFDFILAEHGQDIAPQEWQNFWSERTAIETNYQNKKTQKDAYTEADLQTIEDMDTTF